MPYSPTRRVRGGSLAVTAALLALPVLAACSDEDDPNGFVGTTPVSQVVVQPKVDTIFVRDSLLPSDTVTLRAVVIGFGGSEIQQPTVRWSTPDSNLVVVDSRGTVRPLALGTATVVARSGNKEDRATVVVTWSASRIVVTPAGQAQTGATADTIFVGDSVRAADARQLRAATFDAQGRPVTGVRYTWRSSDPTIATVDSTGLVRAAVPGRPGTVTITTAGGGVTSQRRVVVASIVREVRVTVPRATALVGDTLRATATLLGWPGQGTPTARVAWSTSNPAVATVDSTGLIRFLAPGSVRITATAAFTSATFASDIVVQSLGFGAIAAGWDHTCGVVGTGRMHCWGRGREGQLGVATLDTVCYNMEEPEEERDYPCSLTPKRASTTVEFPRVVTTGGAFSCGVAGTGRAYCWGDDTLGQLGDGKLVGTNLPRLVTAAVPFASLTAGLAHACGITTAQTAFCWGFDALGQLGNSTFLYNASTPIVVDGERRWQSMSAGSLHTCGVTTEGQVLCWGANEAGQVGTATPGQSRVLFGRTYQFFETPVAVVGLPVAARAVVASRGSHTCALGVDGAAYCWGSNESGELGAGGVGGSSAAPRQVPGLTFSQLAAGSSFTCGLSGVAIYCWGNNRFGQLGSGTPGVGTVSPGSSPSPRQIADPVALDPASGITTPVSGVEFVAVTAGLRHACGLARDGAVYCWGSDYLGALGVGQQAMVRSRPVRVIVPPEFAER